MQFDLNWVGEYIPKLVTENEFLNDKLENDTYGIYYSVLFDGDADTYLLQAKKPPVEGQAEWGMIEMSKSGKSKRFKRVKREDGTSSHSSGGKAGVADYEPSTNTRWAIGMAYRAYVQVMGNPEGSDGNFPFDEVKTHAAALLKMFDELKSGSHETSSLTSATQPIKAQRLTAAATGIEKARAARAKLTEEHNESDIPDFDN